MIPPGETGRPDAAATFHLRLATSRDLPALRELIPASVRALSVGHYTSQQVESAIRHVFGPDTQLIADGTYFVVETGAGEIVGCGGWSRRQTLCGGDQMKGHSPLAASDDLLDPAVDGARVRAFFVVPGQNGAGSARACWQHVSTRHAPPDFRGWNSSPRCRACRFTARTVSPMT